jgi:hypothetical protein
VALTRNLGTTDLRFSENIEERIEADIASKSVNKKFSEADIAAQQLIQPNPAIAWLSCLSTTAHLNAARSARVNSSDNHFKQTLFFHQFTDMSTHSSAKRFQIVAAFEAGDDAPVAGACGPLLDTACHQPEILIG